MTITKLGRTALAAASMVMVAASANAAPQAASGRASTNGASGLQALRNGVDIRTGTALMRVEALTDTTLRVRIAPSGSLPENASWAVPAAVRAQGVAVVATPDGFNTNALAVHVDPATLRLTVTDRTGRPIVADAPRPLTLDGAAFTLRKTLRPDEHIFALGDKTGGSLDRRGRTFVNWNTDAYAFDSTTDPIYKAIPFFLGVDDAGRSYGLLFDNTWRSWFDFGHRDADTLAMGSPGGPIDYYILAGPAVRDVVRGYTALTGHAPLPPLWAFGYQQSRYSYMSAAEVRDIAGKLASSGIPTDAMWLDIDFLDRNRPFTVNRRTYPDLKGLAGELGRQGIKLVTIADLHIANAPGEGYAPYDSGTTIDAFVHAADGKPFVGKVWPGPSVFPDFTDRRVRAWWGRNFRDFVDAGIAGFWNDMNEPSVFNDLHTMPVDAVHRIDADDFAPRSASHAELHNVYGMENTRATYEGMQALRPGERPFVMTRASYAGGQRYAVTWTGDNSSTWDHLRLAVNQMLNLGLSGFSYAGTDVGGYAGGASPALMTRWYQIAAFGPIFRAHAEKGSPRAEPWVDGPEHLSIRRRFVEERYRLLPYIYALADANTRNGDPLMRPVFYDYPEMIASPCKRGIDFTLGRSLLVAPAPKGESEQPYEICLPKGGWYDYWSGLPVTANPPPTGEAATLPGANLADRVTETPRIDRMPVFVRAGTILPRQAVVTSTALTPAGPLRLDVYPGADCSGTLYLDDGHSTAATHGRVLRQSIRCEQVPGGGLLILFNAREQGYRPWWREIAVTVHGAGGAARVTRGRSPVASSFDAAARTVAFTLADAGLERPTTIALATGGVQ